MSRVTIDNIQHDASGLDNMSWADITKLYQIEVVPRKMVEMIIANCSSKESRFDFNGEDDKRDLMRDVIGYAESLLEQFEED